MSRLEHPVISTVESGQLNKDSAEGGNIKIISDHEDRKLAFRSKHFFDQGTRHAGECYQAIIAPDGQGLAWLRVAGTRESLIYKAFRDAKEWVLARNTYILSPCFAGVYLFWVENIAKDWRIRGVNLQAPDSQPVLEPFAETGGRPMSLAASTHSGHTVLVWEERTGTRTGLKFAWIIGSEISAAGVIDTGGCNAYDPACVISRDGTLTVAYCAFSNGNYRIMLQEIDRNGKVKEKAVRLSDSQKACIHPSLCLRSEGGVWFSYTCLDASRDGKNLIDLFGLKYSLVQHYRHAAQIDFFNLLGCIYAGCYDQGMILTPAVFDLLMIRSTLKTLDRNTSGADRSSIFEDGQGQVGLLFRQRSSDALPEYAEQEQIRNQWDQGYQGINVYPDICLTTLSAAGWTEPRKLLPRAHFTDAISFCLKNKTLHVAFAEDGRLTGVISNGEWFDQVSQLGVGIARIELDTLLHQQYELFPYVSKCVPGPSMEEPALDYQDKQWIMAIGQTHKHSEISVCMRAVERDPHMNYRFQQDVQHCSFGCIADHESNMWQTEKLIVRKLAEYYYFPGEFVAIPAYEWTGSSKWCAHDGGPFGHLNPLWLEEEGDLVFYNPADPDDPGNTPLRLWAQHRGQKVVTIPHHVADLAHPFNWDFFDEEKFTPVIELVQEYRGSGEDPAAPGALHRPACFREHYALVHLKKGSHFGFIGGADHVGMTLAGALVRELTRTGLYEAFLARRCFATTDVSLCLRFTCNGQEMGSIIHSDAAAFRLKVVAPEPIREIQIVRNGEDQKKISVGNLEIDYSWQAKPEKRGEFWYCRIIMANGEMAWSSPIWLE